MSAIHNPTELLSAFREHYYRFHARAAEAIQGNGDSNVLARLIDDLEHFDESVEEVL